MTPRPLFTRILPLAATLLAACSDAPSASRVGPPAKVAALLDGSFSATAGEVLAQPLTAKVTDAEGRGVAGIEVRFSFAVGPVGAQLSPARVLTDAAGTASATLQLSSEPGSYVIFATAAGIATPARFSGFGSAGTAAAISITPFHPRLRGAGDSVRLRATLVDAAGNDVPSGSARWSSPDTTLFTIDSLGWLRAKRSRIIAAARVTLGGRSDSVRIVVSDTGASPCFGGPAPTALAPGQLLTLDTRAGICLPAGPAEYVAVAMHGSSVSSSTVSLSTFSAGTVAPGATPGIAGSAIPGLVADPGFELSLRALERREAPAFSAPARSAMLSRATAPTVRQGIAASVVPSTVAAGDLLTFNIGLGFCSPVQLRGARVMAVGSRAIVAADTSNPAGGFTTEDYQRYAATFDTLIAPVDEANFGTPYSVDGQPRAVIFFTRAVNELASAPGTYVGGFYYQRDLLPKSQGTQSVCPGSNETEMFYMMVPDTGGTLGNAYSRHFVDSVTVGTIGHEYQHLINASRRLYVTKTDVQEEVWVNEGLSHIAEELLLYRSAGVAPGTRLDATRLADPVFRDAYGLFGSPNLARYRAYLQATETNSPFAAGDQITTRGAIWSFLRYAADQAGGNQQQTWYRLVNTTEAGLQNLRTVFGRDPLDLARAWAVSVGIDGLVTGLPTSLTQPSWDFRSAWPQWRGPYPLKTRTAFDGATTTLSLRGTGAAYLRFSTSTREALLDFSTAGGPASQAITVTLVRIR